MNPLNYMMKRIKISFHRVISMTRIQPINYILTALSLFVIKFGILY